MYAYVGSRTTRERNARGEGISVFKVDQERGTLTSIQTYGNLINPSYLALNRSRDCLYTVHGDGSDITAFTINPLTGELALLNSCSCEGRNPVHLALDPAERFMVVSNHLSGSLAVIDIHADGALGRVLQLVALEGQIGPHRGEQPFSKPHFNLFDPSGQFVLVPDKGLDCIFSFRFQDGRLQPASPPSVNTREGAGPRHMAFHPHAPFAYTINELDSSVTAYRFNRHSGALQPFQVLPCLPASFTGNSRASAILVDDSGHYLYASNRGYDSVAVYAIEPGSGLLQPIEYVLTEGKTPRFVTLTPNRRFMFALNEDSDNIVSMAVDVCTGQLTSTGFSIAVGSPVCMVFSQ
jgi:6-phosphogluconolactonase